MIRFITKWLAKWSYVFQLEWQSAKSEINADLSKRNADEKRSLSEKIRTEADAIEASIKQVEAEEEERKKTEEYQKLAAQEKYEDEHASKKERQDAEGIVAEKRRTAEQHDADVKGGIETEKHLRMMADNGRQVADKIRSL